MGEGRWTRLPRGQARVISASSSQSPACPLSKPSSPATSYESLWSPDYSRCRALVQTRSCGHGHSGPGSGALCDRSGSREETEVAKLGKGCEGTAPGQPAEGTIGCLVTHPGAGLCPQCCRQSEFSFTCRRIVRGREEWSIDGANGGQSTRWRRLSFARGHMVAGHTSWPHC